MEDGTTQMRERTLEVIEILAPYFFKVKFDHRQNTLWVEPSLSPVLTLDYPFVRVGAQLFFTKPTFNFLENRINYPSLLPAKHPWIGHEVGHWFHHKINPYLWNACYKLGSKGCDEACYNLGIDACGALDTREVMLLLQEVLADYAEATLHHGREINVASNLDLNSLARLTPLIERSEPARKEYEKKLEAKLKIWAEKLKEYLKIGEEVA